MRRTGASVAKIAVKTSSLSDLLPLLDLAGAEREQGGLVLIGMGDFGLATRVLPGRFGSAWTYAGAEQHVGQISTRTLLEQYRFRQLTDATDIYGIVGLPVSHSVSPAMHNAAFAAAGLDAVYLPLPAVSADDVVAFGRALRVKGLSVTIPHKVTLLGRVDDMSDTARRVGALNTVRVVEGRWIGENTDSAGFLAPLHEHVPLAGLRAAVLGSGGSARAAVAALGASGCHVRVHARSSVHAEAAAALAGGTCGAFPPEPGSWDLLVNCTPVGMYPRVDETPVPATHLTGRYVYDLVYNPQETRLLREAAAAGCQTIGGLDMLVAQAREQFLLWTGVSPSVEVMRAAARQRLAEFQQP
jgi:3-dehydroquinate dehydratase/shikimate dehydrogenase